MTEADAPPRHVTYDIPCPHCRKQLSVELPVERLLSIWMVDSLRDDIEATLRSFPRGLIADLEKDVTLALDERDEARRTVADLQGRLYGQISQQAGARTDLGTVVHTQHRELAAQVDSLVSGINRAARAWRLSLPDQAADPDIRQAQLARGIFQIFFDGGSDAAWDFFVRTDPEWERLAADAAAVSMAIAAAPGYQSWVWDFARKGHPFNATYHRPWQNSANEGTITLTVIPAYFVDGVIIATPFVTTTL